MLLCKHFGQYTQFNAQNEKIRSGEECEKKIATTITTTATAWMGRNSNSIAIVHRFVGIKGHLIYVNRNSLDVCNLVKFSRVEASASHTTFSYVLEK